VSDRTDRRLYAVALLLGVAPLWVASALPMVDLPQHLHLISVLHRLDDPTTLYPDFFTARNALTPYLGYYYLVSGLSWLLPLEVANRLFLSAYVAGLSLSLAFLLSSLGRPTWPSLLALPFAYGDSFAWGSASGPRGSPRAWWRCSSSTCRPSSSSGWHCPGSCSPRACRRIRMLRASARG
jgi:hypothetical protein